jgi:uncharacterized protein (DUF736 family)
MKEFAIFKAKEKKNPKSPDYNITIKINDKFLTIGGAWLRETKTGEKFFSCKMSNGYKDFKGFSITRDEVVVENSTSKEEINANDIPFI